ncbi:MAG TPA: Ig-like domain-containing protein, partial [Polyangiales bacterium]
MYLRALILGLGVVLASCAGASEDGNAALDAAPRDSEESLLFEVEQTSLLPNRKLTLKARYLDGNGTPQGNVLVDFSITGAAAGASLMPSRAFTDSQGIATTTLRAGSTAGTLEVRARAGDTSYDTVKI